MTTTDCRMCTRWNDDPDLRVVELEHSFVMLNRDQFFSGYTFLFTKSHVTELFYLDAASRTGLMEEVSSVAAALHRVFKPDKMNYELLGNMVPHIHWHLVPRCSADHLWPRPIWSEPHEEKHLRSHEYLSLASEIRGFIC